MLVNQLISDCQLLLQFKYLYVVVIYKSNLPKQRNTKPRGKRAANAMVLQLGIKMESKLLALYKIGRKIISGARFAFDYNIFGVSCFWQFLDN